MILITYICITMIKVNKDYYTIAIANKIDEEFGAENSDDKTIQLIKESIDETINYYDETFGEIDDWEVFEYDLLTDAKRKLGLLN